MKSNVDICVYTNKLKYKDAHAAVIEIGRQARHRGKEFVHYHCKKCHGWHLSTLKKREKPDEDLPS